MNIKAYIDNTEFFSGISEKNRELLASICIPKNLEKKQTLFHEGDTGNAFFLEAMKPKYMVFGLTYGVAAYGLTAV